MNSDLMDIGLKKGYMTVFERSDEVLEGFSHLVVTLPLHILAADSIRYVTFLSNRLSFMLPSVHDELLETGRVWKDYVFAEGPRKHVKDKIRLVARLKRENPEPETQRLLRALSTYLHITEGEHNYMEASLLYMTGAIIKDWKKEGIAALAEERKKALADEMTESLLATKKEMVLKRKSGFSKIFTMGSYNTELLYRIKLKEQNDMLVRKAQEEKRRAERRAAKESSANPDSESMKRKRAILAVQSGRARASQLRPEPVKALLRNFGENCTFETIEKMRNLLHLELMSRAPQTEEGVKKLLRGCRDWEDGKMTAVALRRMCASFMIPLIRTGNIKAIYTAEALALTFTKNPEDMKFVMDLYLVPFCITVEELKKETARVIRETGLRVPLMLLQEEQYTTI